MTQCNNINVKLSDSQLNKFKLATKNKNGVTLRSLLNNDNSNDETNFPHKLMLTNRQVANLHKAFANNLLVNIKLSKPPISKIIQLDGFLRRISGPFIKFCLPLMKNYSRKDFSLLTKGATQTIKS